MNKRSWILPKKLVFLIKLIYYIILQLDVSRKFHKNVIKIENNLKLFKTVK